MGKLVVIKDLAPLFPLVYEGLDASIQWTNQFFNDHGKSIDPFLAPSLVRWNLRDYLLDKAQLLADYEPEEMPNIGLSFRYGQYHIRVWKTSNGEVPQTGSSKRKKIFLRQGILQPRFPWAVQVSLNLVILWSVDKDYNLDRVFLACPKEGILGSRYSEWEWSEPIDPASTLRFDPAVSDVFGLDLDFEARDDDNKGYEAKEDQA